MSRYESYQRKKLEKRALYYGIFALFVIIVFFWIGIPFLANSSFLLTNIFKRDSLITQNESVFGALRITDIPDATNSASIKFSGVLDNVEKVDIFLNEQKVKSFVTRGKSEFTEEIEDLKIGVNEIYFVAKLQNSTQRKETEKYIVIYKTAKPKLEITSPADNSKTSKDEIVLSGNTDKDAAVRVNGLPVVVDANGNFQTSLKLKEGENKIEVLAQDNAGNQEMKSITVTYERD